MIHHENDCVDCPQGCINCGRKDSIYFICDDCGDYVDDLYIGNDGGEYCSSCVLDHLETVRVEE